MSGGGGSGSFGPMVAAGVFGISANVTTHAFPLICLPCNFSLHAAAASDVVNSTAQHPLLFPVALSAKNVSDFTRPNSAKIPSNSASVVHHVSDATYTAVGRPSSTIVNGDAVRGGIATDVDALALALAVPLIPLDAVFTFFTGASSSTRALKHAEFFPSITAPIHGATHVDAVASSPNHRTNTVEIAAFHPTNAPRVVAHAPTSPYSRAS